MPEPDQQDADQGDTGAAPGEAGPERGEAGPVRVEIWSDVVCPWCYIGKRRFETALAAFPQRDRVEVVWRSFQLNPDAPRAGDGTPRKPMAQYLADKYGSGPDDVRLAQAGQMMARVDEVAAAEGLHYDQSATVATNTTDAHRLLHAALDHGGPALQGALKERLLAAYFTQGQDVGDAATLVRLAVEAGLPEVTAREVLDGEAYTSEVLADVGLARSIGVTGVPFLVADRRFGVSGAQPVEVFAAALARALDPEPST